MVGRPSAQIRTVRSLAAPVSLLGCSCSRVTAVAGTCLAVCSTRVPGTRLRAHCRARSLCAIARVLGAECFASMAGAFNGIAAGRGEHRFNGSFSLGVLDICGHPGESCGRRVSAIAAVLIDMVALWRCGKCVRMPSTQFGNAHQPGAGWGLVLPAPRANASSPRLPGGSARKFSLLWSRTDVALSGRQGVSAFTAEVRHATKHR